MRIFALTLIILILLAGMALAQNDPIGETDTVSIAPMTISPGQEFSVSINLWNDEELGAVTLPFSYPVDKLDFMEIDFTGGRIEYLSTKPVTVDEAAGTILVGGIVITENFIQPGDGSLFNIKFKAKDDLTTGEIIHLDTTFIPPSNSLFFFDHTGAVTIRPVFNNGGFTVSAENKQPFFTPIPDIYIAEGDSLYIDVQVTDPDGDSVIIVNPIHPYNSEFTDNGDGTGRFAWMPDHIGPLSADMSPFYFVFWTSDGAASNYVRVKINVINVNRAPQINAPENIEAEAGDSLGINVSAFDPDFENTTWDISGLPAGATFNFENPGLINWNSDFADSGHYTITLTAYDPFGMADTATIEIELLPVTLFSMRIDTVTSFSGRLVTLNVYLKNKIPVNEFNTLIRIDPSVLSVFSIDRTNTRCKDFGVFSYKIGDNLIDGNIRISGRADGAAPIGEGEGILFRLTMRISSDLNFVGHQIPVNFIQLFSTDNLLVLEDGTRVYASSINLFNGHVLISADGDIMLGDINLNSIAYEISDAVYFSNFFISSTQYPLNELQVANSDINRDGNAPSVADLVVLIKILTGEADPLALKPVESMASADIEIIRDETGLFLSFNSPVDIGGVLVRFTGKDIEDLDVINMTDMDMMGARVKETASYLLLSYESKSIPAGEQSVLKISDNSDLEIEIAGIELSDVSGNIIPTRKVETEALPTEFDLLQNYPNPFNPTTEIKFNLESPSWVTLTVFNILGQEVIRLADREYAAGQHSVTWNSTNASGEAVASGIYLYRIKADEKSASRKMVLLK
ncbi:MAG: T9SS type A sorting domain-containing protein [candidate division Zixibacteria bacterium]|nr:T9SS type A sorting domain-containing protein [candidate division Zixibacteria bacterium]